MRVKLLVLAVGAALVLAGLIWGSELFSDVARTQGSTTLSRGAESTESTETSESSVSSALEKAAQSEKIPNVMKGGIGQVNQNLEQLRLEVQGTVDARPQRIEDRLERATKGQ